jgi:putative transposase
MCFKAKNLYNYANYLTTQEFINNGKYLFPFELNKTLKGHEAFKALPAKTSQQIIIKLGLNWKSYFQSIKIWAKNKKQFLGKPKLPKYKKKNGRSIVYFDYMQGSWKDNKYYFPNQKQLFIETNITEKQFKLCEIIPYGNCYKISVIYEKEKENLIKPNEKIVAIDLGVNNLATLTNNAGLQPVIINGRVIKSINNYFNKQYAKAQSYIPRTSTKRMRKLTLKRNNILDTQLHRISRFIINYCIDNDIANISIGTTTSNWKQNINIGAKNNQIFTRIPHEKLIQQIIYKSEEVGILVKLVDEKYTSKASFLDNDILPDEFGDYVFSGKRVKRGLYQSSTRQYINADVNASYNILRKSNPQFLYEGIKGLSLIPIRLNIS